MGLARRRNVYSDKDREKLFTIFISEAKLSARWKRGRKGRQGEL